MPNHYQRGLFDAIRGLGVDLRVAYYEAVPADRKAMGWSAEGELADGERFVPKDLGSLDLFPGWRSRIHFVPGYGAKFLLQLAHRLSREDARWVHWSERSHRGLRWGLTFPIKRAYAHLVNARALGAFGIGRKAVEDFERWGMRPEKLAILPYSPAAIPMDGPLDEACMRFRGDDRAFLFLGGLDHRKGIDLLLRAFARLPSTRYKLLLVGNDRSGGEFARLSSSLGIADRVLFRGPMPPRDLPSAIRAAHVLVLPSRFDGWGVTLNEAASGGLALIGSDECGASDHLIRRGDNGFVVRAGSVDSLAQALGAYVEDPDLAARHGAVSRVIFEDYTPRRAAERMMHVLSSWTALRLASRDERSARA